MEKLQVREIQFDGKRITTALIDGKVYVSVKSVCENLGMDEVKFKNQREKINKDELLKGGRIFHPLQTNGGMQNVMMLELEYLPIWLAKINPSRFTDELKGKLLIYQLKAKDVLADEFLGKRPKKDYVRYEPELNEIEDRVARIRDNREKVRDLLVQIANDYDWIRYRADMGFDKVKAEYKETKRTKFNSQGKELSLEEIDALDPHRFRFLKQRLEK